MIKGRPPFPFDTIALAVAFTPDLPLLMAEMKRLCDLHNSLAIYIHVGKKTGEKQRELAELLSANGFHDGNSRIYWEQGDIVNEILQICKHEVADLLLIGASEKNNFSLPIGQIANGLATKSKCSVLIFTGSSTGGYKKIVVDGSEHDKTDLTILTSVYFAEKENVPILDIASECSHSSYSEESTGYSDSPAQEGLPFIQESIEKAKVDFNFLKLPNSQYTSVSEYAFRNKADLVVTHSSDHHLLIFDRISQEGGIDSILKNLPCNLLIVHSRLPE